MQQEQRNVLEDVVLFLCIAHAAEVIITMCQWDHTNGRELNQIALMSKEKSLWNSFKQIHIQINFGSLYYVSKLIYFCIISELNYM